MAVNVTDMREWVAKRIAPTKIEAAVANGESIGVGDASGTPDIFGIEDIGWMPADTTQYTAFNDLSPIKRMNVVRRARIYFNQDAMSRQAARLHTSYAIGRGMSIKARVGEGQEESDPEAKALQQDADDFWEHPDNSYVFSFEAQHENSDKLVVDGELFFLLYPPMADEDDAADLDDPDTEDSTTRVRVIDDCLQIAQIITNPEDNSEPWYYLRQWKVNGLQKQRLYPDYRLFLRDERDAEDNLRLPDVPDTGYSLDLKGVEVAATVFVRHVKTNTLGQRGISTLAAMMDWAKVNRQYLEDRATVSRALSRFAWKRMVKGPASAVAAFGRRAASKIGGTAPGSSAVPPAPAGSTLTTNGGVDWEAMQTPEGGRNAYTESRNFRLMGFMSVGFAEHYFGDGSMGTRATSKSMERPVELLLTDYQTLWKKVYESLFAFDRKARGKKYDAHAVWVDAPQILEDDTVAVVMSYVSLIGVLPGLGVDEVVIRLLNALGIDAPQDVLPKIREREKAMYDFALQKAAITAGLDLNANVDPNDPQALAKQNAALAAFISFITDPDNPAQAPGPKSGPQFGPSQPGQSLRTRIPTPSGMKPAGDEAFANVLRRKMAEALAEATGD